MLRRALVPGAALGAAALALSGMVRSDPETPPGLPGLPPPFLGVAVVGSGDRTAAVDAYGNVVDLRASGPAGRARVAVSPERQAAGSVDAGSAIVARAPRRLGSLPLWRADSVRQRYRAGGNALVTVARFGNDRVVVVRQFGGRAAIRTDRRWLARARPLGGTAPPWAQAMYERSLLVLRALTDRRSGAAVAGAREGWAYVWPRDAAAVALAFAAAGYRAEARRVTDFLLGLELGAAARFDGIGEPVGGREAQGDAGGWVAAAARAAGMHEASPVPVGRPPGRWGSSADRRAAVAEWRERADYQEKSAGDYLANAIASSAAASAIRRRFGSARGLIRESREALSGPEGEPGAGAALDSAAAWAVRPFPRPALYPLVRRTLLNLAAAAGRFGIVPSEDWPQRNPWTASTAWSAWSLAALARRDRQRGAFAVARRERRAAQRLMAALRRAATPLGLLPERVDRRTGLPTSTTPLAWSHAFAVLALHDLWARGPDPRRPIRLGTRSVRPRRE